METKLEDYKQALADVTAQLTAKRSELHSLARKTVADLESSIPTLQSQVILLNKQISDLENVRLQKIKESTVERESCIAHYDDLEKSLKESYSKKINELSLAKEEAVKIVNSYSEKEKELSEKQKELSVSQLKLKSDSEVLESNRKLYLDSVDKLQSDVISHENNSKIVKESNDQERQIIIQQQKDLAIKIKEAKDRERAASDVIKRLDEIAKREFICNNKEQANIKRTEELNAFHVKLLADNNRNNLRSNSLDEKEKELIKREDNVKIAESSLIQR